MRKLPNKEIIFYKQNYHNGGILLERSEGVNPKMRIIFLSDVETFFLDIVAWLFFHLSIGYYSSRIPLDRIDPKKSWFLTKPWEKGGEIYQKLFRVKDWKKIIPSGAALYRNAYELKHLSEMNINGVRLWITESCRSEICHWIMIIPGFFFYLWNTVEIGRLMLGYAIVNNIVPIIMQRYNRPRARKLLAQMERKLKLDEKPQIVYESPTTYSHSYQ